ncbi:MAG: hypothetical protein HC836_44925 [Richelia sp. RM2_1_2]|nr:hypothetical protein [Richelia sp. RM2_1_2]
MLSNFDFTIETLCCFKLGFLKDFFNVIVLYVPRDYIFSNKLNIVYRIKYSALFDSINDNKQNLEKELEKGTEEAFSICKASESKCVAAHFLSSYAMLKFALSNDIKVINYRDIVKCKRSFVKKIETVLPDINATIFI